MAADDERFDEAPGDGSAAPSVTGRSHGVQKRPTARGLTGTGRRLKPLMRKVTEAFRAQDLAGVTTARDVLVDVIEGE